MPSWGKIAGIKVPGTLPGISWGSPAKAAYMNENTTAHPFID
jgi:hypothetical protein